MEAATGNPRTAIRKSLYPCNPVKDTYIAKYHLSKMEKAEWYFCFRLTKQTHTITRQRQTQEVGCMNSYISNSNTNISGHAALNSLVFE